MSLANALHLNEVCQRQERLHTCRWRARIQASQKLLHRWRLANPVGRVLCPPKTHEDPTTTVWNCFFVGQRHNLWCWLHRQFATNEMSSPVHFSTDLTRAMRWRRSIWSPMTYVSSPLTSVRRWIYGINVWMHSSKTLVESKFILFMPPKIMYVCIVLRYNY